MLTISVFTTFIFALFVLAQGAPITDGVLETREGPFEFEARNFLESRAKAKKPAPAPLSKPAPPPVPPPAPVKKQPSTDQCAPIQGCSQCVASSKNCGFNKTTFKCESRKTSDLQVTNSLGCPLMNQMQTVFPAVNGISAAGIIPTTVAAEWNRISNHVFNGEPTDRNSGRHKLSTWLAAHRDLKKNAGTRDSQTQIVEFTSPLKTVWDDAFYKDIDIENMCAVSIALRERLGQARASFVVQTPLGKTICVETFSVGTGSCFPSGTGVEKGKLSEPCAGKDADQN